MSKSQEEKKTKPAAQKQDAPEKTVENGTCDTSSDQECTSNPDGEKKSKEAKPHKQQKDDQETIRELEEQIASLKEKELRHFAEFDNFRKRTQHEKEELYQNATADCIVSFLTVLDNLERALTSSAESGDLKEGLQMVCKPFQEILKNLGVTEIPAQNQPFDPNCHNAVNTVEDENYGENTVCQVFQKGYQMDKRILRHAMVVVANP